MERRKLYSTSIFLSSSLHPTELLVDVARGNQRAVGVVELAPVKRNSVGRPLNRWMFDDAHRTLLHFGHIGTLQPRRAAVAAHQQPPLAPVGIPPHVTRTPAQADDRAGEWRFDATPPFTRAAAAGWRAAR